MDKLKYCEVFRVKSNLCNVTVVTGLLVFFSVAHTWYSCGRSLTPSTSCHWNKVLVLFILKTIPGGESTTGRFNLPFNKNFNSDSSSQNPTGIFNFRGSFFGEKT